MKDIHGNLKKKFPNPRLALLTTAITLILCSIIGGTLAWLVADTDPVVNTFTVGNIILELKETTVTTIPTPTSIPWCRARPSKKTPRSP